MDANKRRVPILKCSKESTPISGQRHYSMTRKDNAMTDVEIMKELIQIRDRIRELAVAIGRDIECRSNADGFSKACVDNFQRNEDGNGYKYWRSLVAICYPKHDSDYLELEGSEMEWSVRKDIDEINFDMLEV